MENQRLIPLNFKEINGKYLLVNLSGDFIFLDKIAFNDFIDFTAIIPNLENRFYINSLDGLAEVISKYKKSKQYLKQSTSLFIIVVTNRCNLNCIYCQASRNNSSDKRYDMDQSTASKAIDLILQFPGKNLTIEFQGGEPLLNFEIIKFIVDNFKKKNNVNKELKFNIVTNLTEIDKEKINFILENNITLCTSCDGNREVQDYNRPFNKRSSFDALREKLQLIKAITNGKIGMNGILTTTKKSLQYPKEVVDEYLKLGLDSIYIRSVNPFGLAKKIFSIIGYSPYEFLDFYKNCLDYIIEINKKGKLFIEGTAQIFLKKILGDGVNHMEFRSPCGAIIGQIAINYNGSIYTCDEGRMMAQTGDDSFKIGEVSYSLYKNLFDNETTKTMCLASCMESFPRCNQCVYLPYCGICPIINYTEEGDIFKNNSFRCVINEGILDYLFGLLDKDQEATKIFKKWIY